MKSEKIIKITQRLVFLVIFFLALFSLVLILTYNRYRNNINTGFVTKIPWIAFSCFSCGIIGGFVSIQQRLRKIGNDELELLSTSWVQLILVPLFGGIFALVLYTLFLSGIISGSLFPVFVPPNEFVSTSLETSYIDFVSHTFPQNPHEYGKLFFWCFVAGFSERLVPQLISDVTEQAADSGNGNKKPGRLHKK